MVAQENRDVSVVLEIWTCDEFPTVLSLDWDRFCFVADDENSCFTWSTYCGGWRYLLLENLSEVQPLRITFSRIVCWRVFDLRTRILESLKSVEGCEECGV